MHIQTRLGCCVPNTNPPFSTYNNQIMKLDTKMLIKLASNLFFCCNILCLINLNIHSSRFTNVVLKPENQKWNHGAVKSREIFIEKINWKSCGPGCGRAMVVMQHWNQDCWANVVDSHDITQRWGFFNHFKPDDAPGLNLIPIEHREINLILRILMLIILRTGSVLTNNSMGCHIRWLAIMNNLQFVAN